MHYHRFEDSGERQMHLHGSHQDTSDALAGYPPFPSPIIYVVFRHLASRHYQNFRHHQPSSLHNLNCLRNLRTSLAYPQRRISKSQPTAL